MGMSHSAQKIISRPIPTKKTLSDWLGQSKDRAADYRCSSLERQTKDACVAREQVCDKTCPDKVENKQFEQSKRACESPEAAKRRKRQELRASYPLMDKLTQKERHKLLNIGAVLPLSGSSFTNAMLKIHNSYRADHGVPPLRMSKNLNKLAQLRAEGLVSFCARTSTDLKGIPGIPSAVGENIFDQVSNYRVVPSSAMACAHWYSCAEQFNYTSMNSKPGKKAVLFMNMIWKETQEIGTGRAVSSNGNVVIVTLYFPKAEIPSKIRENVFPPNGGSLTNWPHKLIKEATPALENSKPNRSNTPSINKGSTVI
ncbi:hypothetical protein GE061_004165 [Apolygus lucorum]|uniref:SCP domain-containing protein n=1 Tax=Apolygus lucorum TaxID=248454 RepID=A0A8S9WXW7_APOLU|nr:hypothetical protein GE061_004165 [Apolygus lucorum]